MTKEITNSLIFICICIFILTVGQFTPIEISFGGISFVIYTTIFVGLPIVLYRQAKLFYPKLQSKISRVIATIIIILLFGLGTIYVPIFCFGKLMCSDITDKKLFIKHDIFNSRIIVRHYDCGAHDSGFPQEETVIIRNVFGLFNFVTKADTTSIDKVKWRKIAEK